MPKRQASRGGDRRSREKQQNVVAAARKIKKAELQGPYKAEYWTSTGISEKRFGEIRRLKNIFPCTKPGRKSLAEKCKGNKHKIAAEAEKGNAGASTARKWAASRLSQNRTPKRVRSALCTILGVNVAEANEVVCNFLACYMIARELRRLQVDPAKASAELKGSQLPMAEFERYLMRVNEGPKSRPSMHKAMYGVDSAGTQSIHMHNVLASDDTTFVSIAGLVERWQALAVSPVVQVQLVTFAVTFGSPAVMKALQACSQKNLPIQERRPIPVNDDSCLHFLQGVLASGGNVFSCRFRAEQHNAAKSGELAGAAIAKALPRIFGPDDVAAVACFDSYAGKCEYMGRKPGYSADVNTSFHAKNVINVLHALAFKFPHFKAHRLLDKSDHPYGPGAQKYLALRSGGSEQNFKEKLLSGTRARWPKEVRVDGSRVEGWRGASEVDAETIQYNACAAYRLVIHLATGAVPQNLKRTAALRGPP